GVESFIEAFDEPFIALQIVKLEGIWMTIQMPYGYTEKVSLKKLTLDEWDRFHGVTGKGVPFVLSRPAQAEFFRLLEEYSDTSITVGGETIEIPDWLAESDTVNDEKFWSSVYTDQPNPGWDLQGHSIVLRDILAQLKLPKSRILVLGAGKGHDAAFLAEQGHLVTAVDVSPNAEASFREKYGAHRNVTYLVQDLFELPEKMHHAYDVVFEQTCYCAIDPLRRAELVGVWRKVLADRGHLLGIFFMQEPKPEGPPFGSTEWELFQRMKKGWDFMYWTRWKNSIPDRLGRELVVYAQKK
ncbi:MAG: methyltransferase domain-containing protein, partial [Bdellovibrionia bacterium]